MISFQNHSLKHFRICLLLVRKPFLPTTLHLDRHTLHMHTRKESYTLLFATVQGNNWVPPPCSSDEKASFTLSRLFHSPSSLCPGLKFLVSWKPIFNPNLQPLCFLPYPWLWPVSLCLRLPDLQFWVRSPCRAAGSVSAATILLACFGLSAGMWGPPRTHLIPIMHPAGLATRVGISYTFTTMMNKQVNK